jgi:FMN phosphatase YigB (HAD superfamily)
VGKVVYYLLISLLAIVLLLCVKYFTSLIVIKRKIRLNSVDVQKISPINKPVILWDIHGVLFEKSILHWIYLIITHPKFLSALYHMDRVTVSLFIRYLACKMKLIADDITSLEVLNAGEKNGNTDLINLTVRVACDYKPNHAVIEILRKLAARGYTQHAGSNIGLDVLDIFERQYQDVFDLFSYKFIAQMDRFGTVYKKPHENFFKLYLELTGVNRESIVFIDDRPQNIEVAQRCGLKAILYCDAVQLAHDLKGLGIDF